MRYAMVAYYDKDLESFLAPTITNADDFGRIAKDINTSVLKGLSDDKVTNLAHRQLFGIGYYDDDTGILEPVTPKKLLDCDELINKRIALKGQVEKVNKDVQECDHIG